MSGTGAAFADSSAMGDSSVFEVLYATASKKRRSWAEGLLRIGRARATLISVNHDGTSAAAPSGGFRGGGGGGGGGAPVVASVGSSGSLTPNPLFVHLQRNGGRLAEGEEIAVGSFIVQIGTARHLHLIPYAAAAASDAERPPAAIVAEPPKPAAQPAHRKSPMILHATACSARSMQPLQSPPLARAAFCFDEPQRLRTDAEILHLFCT